MGMTLLSATELACEMCEQCAQPGEYVVMCVTLYFDNAVMGVTLPWHVRVVRLTVIIKV